MNKNNYYQQIELLKSFNNYLTACICPAMYARNKGFVPFPNYSHNHGGVMSIVNGLNISQQEFDSWHLDKLAKNYIYAFLTFKDKPFDKLIEDTIRNEPNAPPTTEEQLLCNCLFYGGEIHDDLIKKTILPALRKMFTYKSEPLWGRHYMELPHPSGVTTYPQLFVPPTGKGHVQIESKNDDSFWSIEIDTSPFTWSMITTPFIVPVGYIPLSKIKNSKYKTPEFFKREHLLIQCSDIPIEDWFFTYCGTLNEHQLETFSGGIIELNAALQINEVVNKMVSLIAALKGKKLNGRQNLMIR